MKQVVEAPFRKEPNWRLEKIFELPDEVWQSKDKGFIFKLWACFQTLQLFDT